MCSRDRTTFPLVVSLLLCHGAALPTQAQPIDQRILAMQGGKLTPNRAATLEKQLEKAPDDLDARCMLLGYYSFALLQSPEAKAAHAKHVFWIIEHHPEATIAGSPETSLDKTLDEKNYSKGKKLWLIQAEKHSTNATILGNAATYFHFYEKDQSEELLVKAQKLEPENPEWSEQLGRLYMRGEFPWSMKPSIDVARKALNFFERALKNMSPMHRYSRLANISKAAFAAGEMVKAKQYANELLDRAVEQRPNWNYGNAVHHGNLILGRIALAEGKIDEAEAYLLKAGKTPGSPQLNSFGPNMQLALELLNKGRNKAVIEYLKLCGKFWKQNEIDAWIVLIEAGLDPDFGANLSY